MKFFIKNYLKILLIIILLILLVYVVNITSIPKSIVLFQGEELKVDTVLGIYLKQEEEKYVQASSLINSNENINSKNVKVSLFNLFNVKDIKVDTIPKTTVIPLGNSIGIKLYTSGVLVVGKTEIEGKKPYEDCGIKEGDIIVCINENNITTTKELIECVNNSNGDKLDIEYLRDGNIYTSEIEPIKSSNNEYKIGLWVRDGAAGVGTITYYNPETKKFAALGHGIIDVDTENLISISSGQLVTTTISSIVKGEEGKPGEIRGSIANEKNIGEIYSNTEFGIYGSMSNTASLNINNKNEIEVATRDEIKTGPAKIICAIEDGERKEYDIEITKIYKNNNSNNKSMLIKVTDAELLNLTGGIIQGMSGAPIVQGDKFIGAVTHVLINDPTTGYAVFGDLMIKQMKAVK